MFMAKFALIYLFVVGSAQTDDLPEGKGRDIALTVCASCHPPVFAGMRGDRRFWESMVDRMVVRGAVISEEETKTFIDYMMKFFGPDVNINKADAAALQAELDLTRSEAEAIVGYRAEHGAFKEWADVTKVTAVDAKKLEPKKKRIVF
jgi:competence ComEA-like helix-hairpin-helix protein